MTKKESIILENKTENTINKSNIDPEKLGGLEDVKRISRQSWSNKIEEELLYGNNLVDSKKTNDQEEPEKAKKTQEEREKEAQEEWEEREKEAQENLNNYWWDRQKAKEEPEKAKKTQEEIEQKAQEQLLKAKKDKIELEKKAKEKIELEQKKNEEIEKAQKEKDEIEKKAKKDKIELEKKAQEEKQQGQKEKIELEQKKNEEINKKDLEVGNLSFQVKGLNGMIEKLLNKKNFYSVNKFFYFNAKEKKIILYLSFIIIFIHFFNFLYLFLSSTIKKISRT